jgi:hypothetical protein
MHRFILKWLRNIILSLLLVFGCPGSIAIVADVACNASIETWLPIYPNSDLVSVQHNFVRPRGLGSTFMILRTLDTVEQVESYYHQNVAMLVNQGAPRGMGSTDFQVQEDPENVGSIIVLFSQCIV